MVRNTAQACPREIEKKKVSCEPISVETLLLKNLVKVLPPLVVDMTVLLFSLKLADVAFVHSV